MARRDHGPGAPLAVALAVLLPLAALAAAPARNAEGTTARVHADKGVGCADCHGKARRPAPVASERCLACHGPFAALVQRTSSVKPLAPHDSPHWGADIECNVCHRQHERTVNWCAHCHMTEARVP